MDYRIHVGGRGYSRDYLVKAEDADEARDGALKLFQEEYGRRSAKEYTIIDSKGTLLAQGPVLYE
jgi:hypothetical protein